MDIVPRWSNSWRISALTKRSGSMGCGCHASGTAVWRGCVEGGCAAPELAPVAKLNPTLIPVEAADEVDEKDVERKLLLASPPAAGPVLVWNCPAPGRDASAAETDPDKRVWRLKAPRETPPPASPTVAAVAAVAAATEPAERNPEELPQRSTAGGKPPSRPMGPAVVVVAMVRLRRRAGSVSGASGARLRVADPPQRRASVLEVRAVDQATVVCVLSDAACKYPRGATAEPWRPSPRAGESSPVGALAEFFLGREDLARTASTAWEGRRRPHARADEPAPQRSRRGVPDTPARARGARATVARRPHAAQPRRVVVKTCCEGGG